jgi:hypothetical protein
MHVTVDDQPLAAEELGLETIGQLLAHLQKANRLITHVLIDGEEPDLGKLAALKAAPLRGHTLYIETTEPKVMALEVLAAVEAQLLRMDLSRIFADGRPFTEVLNEFTQQLKLIKKSLEHRDFISLIDTLVYETAETSAHWAAAIRSMRSAIA